MDILELIKKYGAEIPEDKTKEFNSEFRKTYKHESELTTANTKITDLQTQLTDANKKIESFKGMDIDGIKAAADDWKQKYEKAAKDADDKINALKFDHALEGALTASKAKNAKAVKALLDMDGLKMNGEEIVGLSEQLEKIKKENDFLFDGETAPARFVASTPGTKVNTDDKKAEANAAFRAAFGKE